MKNFIFLFAFVLISFLFFTCKSDDEPQYSGCCDTVPLEASLDTGRIFIPNIFTPNGNGYNDIFFPLSDDGIETVNSMIIRNSNNEIVFNEQNFISNNPLVAWDGLDDEGNQMGGLFEYEITVTSVLGETQMFIGNVCVLLCLESDFPYENISSCGFSTQHDGIGNWDEDLRNFEENCF